jgi:1-acyl-sn-glycerol-3-phosphate acyltransferase
LIKYPILKKLWLIIVEAYIKLGFLFYYKKIKKIYLEEIPKDKAVMFLSNHQSALLDPLLITVNSTRKNYFLTRADVFKNRIVKSILTSLQMIPVYRLRDGIRTITKNNEIFSYCSEILMDNNSIILFPEGNHSLNRSVRT